MLNNRQRALVLGGGGFVASSWITGLINGLAESGIDVRDADLLIGTSSGARVALQLTSGAPLEEVFARQVGAGRHFGSAPHVGRQSGAVDMSRVQQEVARAKELGAAGRRSCGATVNWRSLSRDRTGGRRGLPCCQWRTGRSGACS